MTMIRPFSFWLRGLLVVVILFMENETLTNALSFERSSPPVAVLSRRSWFHTSATAAAATASIGCTVVDSSVQGWWNSAEAAVISENVMTRSPKLSLTDSELKAVVTNDIVNGQFLVNGNLTRSIYQSTAIFTDETNTFGMEQWISGTQKLFVGAPQSSVRLVGDVQVTPFAVEFRFDEDLMFNIPFRPIAYLTGKVILTRDESGYISAYREYWDQDIATVLRNIKFN